ncbi:S66 peptidase family protein [Usitatibacter palustris]|uniref:Murein tetrapeptide carboxypeptidase n=1 Tax=Usitatibacter palustris TaxID=2732487 RepID=A0A6M4H8D9_9PROT|nr:LD-carboxypeptidase [Usitatibacter palustris]QJR14644.1 Murein tetrapeptide carboxypeptidase [Usitatibacter palustris]
MDGTERVLRLPRAIGEPATIGVYALSGRVDQSMLANAVDHMRELGHRVIIAEETNHEWRYFAGTDEERVAGFHRLLDDPSIDIMICARGGYGVSRVLAHIDWNKVANSGKCFVGFSDFTGFNMAAYACANLLTFHGPLFCIDFGDGPPNGFMEQHFWYTLSRGTERLDDIACEHGYEPRRIDGRMWGGNLSLVAHLVGTPYFPKIEDGILYVEEIGEEPYAIERMFFQLFHAGVFSNTRAILLGDFHDCKPANPSRYPYEMDEVVETLRKLVPIPVLTELPFGHVARKATLPFGAPATLILSEKSYSLSYSHFLGK